MTCCSRAMNLTTGSGCVLLLSFKEQTTTYSWRLVESDNTVIISQTWIVGYWHWLLLFIYQQKYSYIQRSALNGLFCV